MRIISLFLLFLLLAGCSPKPEYPHKFKRGDCVQMIVDNGKAMVLSTGKYYGWIRIRLPITGGEGDYDWTTVYEDEVRACDGGFNG